MRPRLLALSLAVTLALAACGSDEKTKTVTATDEGKARAAALEQDRAAIEKLMVQYGAAAGADACDFFSRDYLAELGGLADCRRDNPDAKVVRFTVDEVSVDGDNASATISLPGEERPFVYPLVREGEPSDAYDGWKISDASKQVSATAHAPEPSPASDDRAVVEQVMTKYSATSGAVKCAYYSPGLLAVGGGVQECLRYLKNSRATAFTVDNVRVNGDIARVTVSGGTGTEGRGEYQLDRLGDPEGATKGWKISELP